MDYQSKKDLQSSAGAADEELFIKEFENIPRRQIILVNSVYDNLVSVKFMLETESLEWDKRVEGMKIFRCLLIDLSDQNLIINYLKDLEKGFIICIKDLRSKIIRETCITIAYTSVKLQNKCEKFIETLLPLLFNLTQNSAKIISTCAGVSIRFIIQNTHSSKFIPIVHQNLSSKSKDIRRYCCDFLNQLLRTWPKSILEKNLPLLQEDIKKGLNDADPEARNYSRKAFWMFDYYFRDKANQLYSTLDANKKRLLDNEKPADLNPINSLKNATKSSKINSKSNLQETKRFLKAKNLKTGNLPILTPQRAVSSVDVEAIKRAKERNVLLTPTIDQFTIKNSAANISNSSIKENNVNLDNIRTPINDQQKQQQLLLRKPISSISGNKLLTIQPQSNKSLSKITPLNRITRSQPGSRSSSPSLRSVYLNDLSSPFSSDASSNHSTNRLSAFKKSAIPIITKRQSSSNCVDDFTNSPLMNRSFNKSITNQLNNSNRKMNFDYQSDASEISSLCSDRSFSDSKLENIEDIIKCLNSTHWLTKKDGLISLMHFICHSTIDLNGDQLKIITELFIKMLLDPNTKTLPLLLKVLDSFILNYHHKLNFWLYVLLTKLFLRYGSDVLLSNQTRIGKTFDVILNSFSKQDQFNVLIQFLSDPKLTPVIKVKLTSLEYLLKLISIMEASDLNLKQNKYNRDEFEQFLIRIITWAEDKKSVQLTEICRNTILELFNLNTPEFCNIVSQLPAGYWESAYKYMKEKKVSSSSSCNKNKVDDSVIFSQSFYDQILKFSFNNNNNKEDLNQTAIFDSLMLKTTEEINRFTSNLTTDLNQTLNNNETTDFNNHSVLNNQNTKFKIDDTDDQSIYKTSEIEHCEKKTNSMDSGISQLDCALSTNYKSSTSANKLSPESKEQFNNHYLNNIDNSSSSDLTTYNSFKSMNSFYVTTTTSLKDHSLNNNNYEDEDEEINEINNNYERCLNGLDNLNLKNKFDQDKFDQLINKIDDDKQNLDNKLESLEELDNLILNIDNKKNLENNLECLIKLLIKQIDKKELILRQLTIKTFSDLLNTELKNYLLDQQLKLILDKLLFLSYQDYKELNTAIQHFTDILSTNFDIIFFVDYLIQIIDKGQFPSNESSIRLITKFIKYSDEDKITKLVPKIIPSIIKSNESTITSVRKFSIFCLVELFNKVGMVIKPYLSSLESSKIKLLQIYIEDSTKSTHSSTRSSSSLLEKSHS